MKMRYSWLSAAVAALGVSTFASVAAASSHREAPAIANDPAADNTDLYAWVQGSNLIILANYIPLEEPAGGPNFHSFSDEVLYEVKIVRGKADLLPDLTYQIRFSTSPITYNDPGAPKPTPAGGQEFFSQISGRTQTYLVRKIQAGVGSTLITDGKVVPANIGPRTNAVAYAAFLGMPAGKTYEQFFVDDVATSYVKSLGTAQGQAQGRVFAGPRDDGFYVDLGGVFDLAGLRTVLGAPNTPRDNVAGYNTHTIALEIPIDVVNGSHVTTGTANTAQTVGIYATASRKRVTILNEDGTSESTGPWRQVSRLGLPLINEAVIGLQDKDKWNRLGPDQDVAVFGGYFLNPVIVRDAEFAGFYGEGGPLAGCINSPADLDGLKGGRLDVIDVINLKNNPTTDAHDIPLTSTGDVLRVDLGIASGFPNGRPIMPNAMTEQADVTDVELTLLLCPAALPATPVADGVGQNDATFKESFPYLATPWEGFSSSPHAAPKP